MKHRVNPTKSGMEPQHRAPVMETEAIYNPQSTHKGTYLRPPLEGSYEHILSKRAVGTMNMIVGCQIVEHSFKILVGPLALPIGLRMKTRKQTRRGPDLSTKLLPKPGGELRTPI